MTKPYFKERKISSQFYQMLVNVKATWFWSQEILQKRKTNPKCWCNACFWLFSPGEKQGKINRIFSLLLLRHVFFVCLPGLNTGAMEKHSFVIFD